MNGGEVTGLFDEKVAALALLDRGWSPHDVKFLQAAIDPARIGNDVQAAKLRQLVVLYRQAMGLPEDKRISCNFACTRQRVEVLLGFFQWLTRFPATTFTPCVQRIIQSLIEELVLAFDCTIFRPAIEKRLRQWSNLKTPSRTVIDQESDWPADSRRWLRRLSHYRQLAGKETQIPKSLKRPFALIEKRASEIAFLQLRR